MTRPPGALQAADGGRLELKAIVAALSARYAVATGTRHFARRVRLDTFDRRLRAAGLRLEHQIVDSEGRLVLGRTDGSSTVTVLATDPRWPARSDALPTGPVRDAVAPVAGIRALTVVSDEMRHLQRLELHDRNGKTVVRVELDEPASGAVAPAQLTVHTLRGYDEEARQATRFLVGLGLRWVEHGELRPADVVPSPTRDDRAAPATALLVRALNGFHATMLENLPGLLGDVDTEFLHDFRVALRRTRTTLRLGRPALPEVMRSRWEPAFEWIGDMTTPVRDLDVYELDLPTMAGWLVAADAADLDPLARQLRRRRTAERRALVRGLGSARFQRLVTEWELSLARLAGTPPDPEREHPSAGELADHTISRAFRRVARGGTAISGGSPAEDLHRLRRRCKELRYALEVFAPVIGHRPRERAVADLKGLQDVLGRFQDAEVQRRGLNAFATEMMVDGTPAATVLAMGELIAHLDAEQDRARHEFDAALAYFARPSSQRRLHRIGGAR